MYKIGYVYVAGDYVNVGIEKVYDSKTGVEGIRHFQFPRNVVDGEIPTNAKRMGVIEIGDDHTGKFKKIVFGHGPIETEETTKGGTK